MVAFTESVPIIYGAKKVLKNELQSYMPTVMNIYDTNKTMMQNDHFTEFSIMIAPLWEKQFIIL